MELSALALLDHRLVAFLCRLISAPAGPQTGGGDLLRGGYLVTVVVGDMVLLATFVIRDHAGRGSDRASPSLRAARG